MFCEKCGKNNPNTAVNCSSCGAPMPQQEKCDGFADILTYTPPEPGVVSDGYVSPYATAQTEGISEQDMKKIIRKTDNIMKFTQKNTVISLASVIIGIIIVLFSMYVVGVNNDINEKIKSLEDTVEKISAAVIPSEVEADSAAQEEPDQFESLINEIEDYSKNKNPKDYIKEELDGFLRKIENSDVSDNRNDKELNEKVIDLFHDYYEYQVEQKDDEKAEDLKKEILSFMRKNKDLISDDQSKNFDELIEEL